MQKTIKIKVISMEELIYGDYITIVDRILQLTN